jgi:NAD(P)-dependent dehydrogenase (short-subunit alcohol dehydrogenase family)
MGKCSTGAPDVHGTILTPIQASKRSALGRKGTPDDVARVVSFIASDKAAFVTGQSEYSVFW